MSWSTETVKNQPFTELQWSASRKAIQAVVVTHNVFSRIQWQVASNVSGQVLHNIQADVRRLQSATSLLCMDLDRIKQTRWLGSFGVSSLIVLRMLEIALKIRETSVTCPSPFAEPFRMFKWIRFQHRTWMSSLYLKLQCLDWLPPLLVKAWNSIISRNTSPFRIGVSCILMM